VPVARFRPDRSQRRCLARNADLAVRIAPAAYTDEYFALYQRYLSARHRDGGMDDARPDDFARFLYTGWSPTRFIEFRRGEHLLGLAVTDFCPSGLSAVYTFFDPDETARGLGTFAILSQIRLARERGLPHVYLGFWIEGHPKMHYKARYRPLEVLRDGGWHEL
jgi:arginine-tRNA-protein transferase